jgi:hypothetical protein
VDPFGGLPLIALTSEHIDDRVDLFQRHRVGGFFSRARRHRAIMSIDFPVSGQGEVSVTQLSIDSLEWQTLSAPFLEKSQVRFSALPFAYLRVYELRDTFPAYLYQGYAQALFQELPLPSKKNPSGQKRRLSRSDILREDSRMTGIRRRQTHENRPEVSPGQEAFLSS